MLTTLLIVVGFAGLAWLAYILRFILTPRGYLATVRALELIVGLAALLALVVLSSSCGTVQPAPSPVVLADVERIRDARAEAQAHCLALVAVVGVHVGSIEASGRVLQLPDDYPERVYLRCLVQRGQFL